MLGLFCPYRRSLLTLLWPAQPRFATALLSLNQKRISYVGRNPAASPATGNGTIHLAEIEQFMKAAFDLSPAPDRMPALRWKY